MTIIIIDGSAFDREIGSGSLFRHRLLRTHILTQVKSKAEETFYGFCVLITPDQLHALMKSGSQTLLFVLMEYIHKVLPRMKESHRNIFLALSSTVENWYTNNTTLVR